MIERGDHLERLASARDLDDVIVIVELAAGRRQRGVNREPPLLDLAGRRRRPELVQRAPQRVDDLVHRRPLLHSPRPA